MKKMAVIFVVSFLAAGSVPFLIIDDHKFFSYEFFSRVPKQQWVRADSLQKDKLFTGLLEIRQ